MREIDLFLIGSVMLLFLEIAVQTELNPNYVSVITLVYLDPAPRTLR